MPSPIHEHPEEWLAAALADGLPPEERRALDEHLAGCERCRTLQAEFAALDETLLSDFPEAAGPAAGFETRLVAGFRRRHGQGRRIERLRTLVGWLLRQRGAQVVGVAAALLGLVGVGQLLTGGASREERRLANSAVFQVTNALLPRVEEAGTRVPPLKILDGRRINADPPTFRGTVPATDRTVDRDVTAGFGELQIPLVDSQPKSPVLGNIPLVGRLFSTKKPNEDFDSTKKLSGDFDGFIKYGNPIQTVETNAQGIPAARGGIQDQDTKARVSLAPSSQPEAGKSAFWGAYESAAPPPSPDAVARANVIGEPIFAAPTPVPTPDSRKLIRNARAELEVASFDAAVDAITAAATRDGGFLDTRNAARGGNGKLSGTLVVKVLPENLDRFLAGLRTLGDLKNQTIQTEDVTKDYFDTDARLRNARRMEDRLLKMLDEVKGKMSEVLQVEKELGRVRADIEQMQGQLQLYDSQVRYATVTLSLYEKDLRQPSAFVLHETATLALLAADVERAAAEARRIADAAHAQVLRSDLSRDSDGRSQDTLFLLVAPEAADGVIASLKALGRVGNFNIQDERTVQNGVSADAAGTDAGKVERAPVAVNLTISHDEQVSRQLRFTLVAPDPEGTFEKARAAALAAGGEVVEANVAHTPDGHASATLGVRVPAAAEAALVATFKTLGRAGEVETRQAAPGADAGPNAPVGIALSVADLEPAVQQTTVRVRTGEVERRAGEIKREAAAGHVEVEESNFSSESDGRQQARLKFRLPMSAYPGFIARVRALGEVKDFTVQREDRPERSRPGAEASAPAAVEVTLYDEGRIVGEDAGLGATLRRTFGEGAGALMWSVRMIGVALAFLAPWLALLGLAAGGIWWRRRAAHGKPRS